MRPKVCFVREWMDVAASPFDDLDVGNPGNSDAVGRGCLRAERRSRQSQYGGPARRIADAGEQAATAAISAAATAVPCPGSRGRTATARCAADGAYLPVAAIGQPLHQRLPLMARRFHLFS